MPPGFWRNKRNIFSIFAPDGTSLSSTKGANIGTITPLYRQTNNFKKLHLGQREFAQLFPLDAPSLDDGTNLREGTPTICFMVPIFDKQQSVQAILSIHMDPILELSNIPHLTRSDKMGVFYLFDTQGTLINSSSFDERLRQLQSTVPSKTSIPAIGLRDPGGNLTKGFEPTVPPDKMELTRMAHAATTKISGVDVDGYRDYRGVPVVGLWDWDAKYDFGLGYEIDMSEAYASYHSIRTIVLFLTLILSLLFLITFWILEKKKNVLLQRNEKQQLFQNDETILDITGKAQAELDLKMKNQELEQRIQERTAELEKSKKAALSILQDANQSKKRAQDTLWRLKKSQIEQNKLHKAIEFSPVSVVITNTEGNIEYVNPKFSEVTGYSCPEALGQEISFLRSDEHSDSFYKDMWNTILAGNEWHGKLLNTKKDGSLFWDRASISPILNEDAEITNFVSVREDISEEIQAKKKLEQALLKAEEATRVKSDFLANMSHEIRTPMNAIIGMSYLLQQTDLSTRQADYQGNISTSAKSLLNIINNILDFSKIEAGKLKLEETNFNLSRILDDLAAQNGAEISEKGVELLLSVDNDIPHVLIGDPTRVTQIFSNLLNNAVKFTEKGEVEISARVVDMKSQYVVLECRVTDTGIGISQEQRAHLFQKFSQADTSTTRKYGGTGLGLAICRQLVELMCGKIRVEGKTGDGSTFIFSLKLGYRSDRHEQKTNVLPHNLSNLKVLVVDQNDKTLAHLTKTLQSMTFSVESTSDWDEALSIVDKAVDEKNPHELILVDYRSIDATKTGALAKNKQLDQVPVIFMTAVTDVPEVEEVIGQRKLTFLQQKPVTPSGLYNCIVETFGYSELQTHRKQGEEYKYQGNLKSVKGATILLVEDNIINQQVALGLLKEAEVTVILAHDGKEAVECIHQQKFDLVLMDIQMPVMDGISATERIRKLPGKKTHPPIVAMTAHALVGDRERSLEAGMNDYITKPIGVNELYETLFRWINPDDIIQADEKG